MNFMISDEIYIQTIMNKKILAIIISVIQISTSACKHKVFPVEKLQSFLKDSCQTSAMAVYRNGKEVFKYGDIKEVSYLASCRKSVLALLYGPFIETV